MIFKQYTLNGKHCVSNGKRRVTQRKQTRENVCGLCLNANSCNHEMIVSSQCFRFTSRVKFHSLFYMNFITIYEMDILQTVIILLCQNDE